METSPPKEPDATTLQAFDERKDSLDTNLHDIFQSAQDVARQHMDDIFKILYQKYETILKEKEEFLLDIVSQKDALLQTNDEIKRKQSDCHTNFKENVVNYILNFRRRQKNRIIQSRVFTVWIRVAQEEKYQRYLDTIADKVSTNVSKTRVFSRFAYNLVSRNYDQEKRQYLQNFSEQSKQLIGRYEQDVGNLQHRLSIAESVATKERALRQRLEEDIRGMLLKNLSSMNVEAVNVLKQPLLLYPLADEILPPSFSNTEAKSATNTDYISNFKNFFADVTKENDKSTDDDTKSTKAKKKIKPKPTIVQSKSSRSNLSR